MGRVITHGRVSNDGQLRIERKLLTLMGRPSFQCLWVVSLGIIDCRHSAGRNGRYQVLRVLLGMGKKSLEYFGALLNHTTITSGPHGVRTTALERAIYWL